MGLFGFLGRSNNKTKEMVKVQKAFVDCLEKDGSLKNFDVYLYNYYDFISNDEVLGQVIRNHSLTADKMVDYFHLLLANGYEAHKGYLIPLYVFSFAKPMDYFLTEINKGTPIYMIGYTIKQMI